MPDLCDRRKYEKALADALNALFSGFAQHPWWQFDPMQFKHRVEDVLRPQLRHVYWLALLQLSAELGVTVVAADVVTDGWVSRTVGRIGTLITKNTTRQLRDAMGKPLPAEEIAKTVERTFSPERAAGIAATEVTRANTAGEVPVILSYEKHTGHRLVAIWNTEEDEKVCPICKPLDGLPEAWWQTEALSGPPAHPNCRCWLTYEEARKALAA